MTDQLKANRTWWCFVALAIALMAMMILVFAGPTVARQVDYEELLGVIVVDIIPDQNTLWWQWVLYVSVALACAFSFTRSIDWVAKQSNVMRRWYLQVFLAIPVAALTTSAIMFACLYVYAFFFIALYFR